MDKRFLLQAQELSHQKPEYLETLFAVGNGQIGVRAGHPLKVNANYPGNRGFCQWFLTVNRSNTANGLMAMLKNTKPSASYPTCGAFFKHRTRAVVGRRLADGTNPADIRYVRRHLS